MVAQCNLTLVHAGEQAILTQQPLVGTWTFHELGLLLSIGFGGIAVAISLILIFLHATHYSKPNEQRHIIRIIFMIPVYAIVSIISYKYYRYAIYWEVGRDCYEAFAISSFFHLLCYYIAPTLHDQKNYFRTVNPKNWVWPMGWVQCCTGGKDKGFFRRPRSGLTWFNIIWLSIFQYCVVRVAMTFTAMITQLLELYCESSLHPSYAHVWVMCINALAVTVAMYCLIQFYVELKDGLAGHKPFLKVACIKLVIFFSFWQVLLISFLSSGDSPVITTGPRVSYIDVKVGIPCVLLTFEMSLFSIMHIFAFPWKPYLLQNQSDPEAFYKGGFLGTKALLDCFNPWDIIKASARGFRWLFVGARKRHEDPSYKLETATHDPKSKDDTLPAFKIRSDDAYSGEIHRVDSSMNPTATSTRPHTRDDDYNDNALLLKHQHSSTSTPLGQTTGRTKPQNMTLAAPYPYSQDEDTNAAGYKTVALHSPSIEPHGMDLPYPSNTSTHPSAMPMSMPMPTAITTDARAEPAAVYAAPAEVQAQGAWPQPPPSPQGFGRQGTWPHPRSPQATSMRFQANQRLQQGQQQQQSSNRPPPQDGGWRSTNAAPF